MWEVKLKRGIEVKREIELKWQIEVKREMEVKRAIPHRRNIQPENPTGESKVVSEVDRAIRRKVVFYLD